MFAGNEYPTDATQLTQLRYIRRTRTIAANCTAIHGIAFLIAGIWNYWFVSQWKRSLEGYDTEVTMTFISVLALCELFVVYWYVAALLCLLVLWLDFLILRWLAANTGLWATVISAAGITAVIFTPAFQSYAVLKSERDRMLQHQSLSRIETSSKTTPMPL